MAVENNDEVIRLIWRTAGAVASIALRERIRIYRDDRADLVEAKIKSMFQDERTWARLKPLISNEINLCKKIINETAMVYRGPAIRYAAIGEESEGQPAVIDERYSKILDESRINIVMQSVNRYTKLVNHTLVRPVMRKGKIEYDIILPDQFEIYTDENDWKNVVAVKYYTGDCDVDGSPWSFKAGSTSVSKKKGYIWVKQTAIVSHNGKPITLEAGVYEFDQSKSNEPMIVSDFPYQKNGENVLPFLLTYKEFPIETLLNFTQDSALADTSLTFDVMFTYLNEIIKYQSHAQLVITGDVDLKLPDRFTSGPGTIHKLLATGGNADMKAVDVHGPIKELADTIMQRIQMVCAQYGIPPSALTLTGTPQSGYAMKMDRSGLEEIRKADVEHYREFEKELFELTRIVNNTDGGKKISEAAEFHIDFAEPDYPMSPQEEGTTWGARISNNVATAVDWIMSENPDIDRKEAEQRYLVNKAINSPTRGLAPLTLAKPDDMGKGTMPMDGMNKNKMGESDMNKNNMGESEVK